MIKILFTSLLLFSLNSIALVDMRNANYAETWIDMEVQGSGYNLRVQRTYNSRSLINGMFGFGWCSDFETSLEITSEGNLKLTECGAGLETIYMAPTVSKNDTETAVNQIIAKLKSTNSKLTKAYINELTSQLRNDRRMRDKLSDDLGLKAQLQKGTRFFANGRGPDFIDLKDSAYVRKLPGGEVQRFDSEGRMIQIIDKNANSLTLSYSGENLRDVVDNNGRKLSFSFYPNKKIKKITGPNGVDAEYSFKNLNDLEVVKNGWGNTYRYAYDDLHNLVSIDFPDKSKKVITYDTNKDWVTSFKDRDGCKEEYKYELSKDDPKGHYWSTVVKKCGDKVVSSGKYEFWYKTNPQKSDAYLSRVLIKNNNDSQDITYHPVFGRPVLITKNGSVTKFEYDEKSGLLSRRTEGKVVVDFEYDDACKKVNKVSQGKNSTNFKYDEKCNLTFAKNTKGQVVNLSYDHAGRISSLSDQAKRQVNIKYEERFGKPATVERPGVGSLKVTYKPNGDINKVDSPAGPTVAVQVAGAFNNLLEVVEPAGVDLGL
jgi:YD repeat-containing protein